MITKIMKAIQRLLHFSSLLMFKRCVFFAPADSSSYTASTCTANTCTANTFSGNAPEWAGTRELTNGAAGWHLGRNRDGLGLTRGYPNNQ